MYESINHLLLGLWTKNIFMEQTRVKYITFKFLCERLGTYLKKDDIYFRVIIQVQERVGMPLHRLGNGYGLQNIRDSY